MLAYSFSFSYIYLQLVFSHPVQDNFCVYLAALIIKIQYNFLYLFVFSLES